MAAIPQVSVIFFLDSAGVIRAELPGQNGARVKVIIDQDFVPSDIRAALYDKRDALAKQTAAGEVKEREYSLERAKRVFDLTLAHHGRDLAERVVPALAGRRKTVLAKKHEKGITVAWDLL